MTGMLMGTLQRHVIPTQRRGGNSQRSFLPLFLPLPPPPSTDHQREVESLRRNSDCCCASVSGDAVTLVRRADLRLLSWQSRGVHLMNMSSRAAGLTQLEVPPLSKRWEKTLPVGSWASVPSGASVLLAGNSGTGRGCV